MKKTLIILLFFTSLSSYSQFKTTGYFDAKIGVSYIFSDKFQAELRANDNLGIEFNTELSLLYKVISKEDYNLNFGLGISTFLFSENLEIFDSLFIPLQLEITPFKEIRNLAFV